MEENRNDELEKYKITLDFLKFEATTLWQIFSAFLIANTILLGFVSDIFSKSEIDNSKCILLLLAGLFGLIIATVWLITFRSNSNWYYYRMQNQAKKAEEKFIKSINDDEWFLLNKDAERFANSNTCISNKCAGYIMISIFIIVYFSLVIWSLCNLKCCCCCCCCNPFI